MLLKNRCKIENLRNGSITLLLLLIFQSCANQNKTQDEHNKQEITRTNKTVSLQKKDDKSNDIKIGTLSAIPDDIIGTGSSFYFNDKFEKKNIPFWVDCLTEGVININGKQERMNSRRYKDSECEFSNNHYIIHYKIFESTPISDESANFKGLMTIKRVGGIDSTEIKFEGNSY